MKKNGKVIKDSNSNLLIFLIIGGVLLIGGYMFYNFDYDFKNKAETCKFIISSYTKDDINVKFTFK